MKGDLAVKKKILKKSFLCKRGKRYNELELLYGKQLEVMSVKSFIDFVVSELKISEELFNPQSLYKIKGKLNKKLKNADV